MLCSVHSVFIVKEEEHLLQKRYDDVHEEGTLQGEHEDMKEEEILLQKRDDDVHEEETLQGGHEGGGNFTSKKR